LVTSEAREVSEAVMDLSDFVLQQVAAQEAAEGVQIAPSGKVAYPRRVPQRVQNLGYRGRDLLKWAGRRQLVDTLLRAYGRHLGDEDPNSSRSPPSRCRGPAGRE